MASLRKSCNDKVDEVIRVDIFFSANIMRLDLCHLIVYKGEKLMVWMTGKTKLMTTRASNPLFLRMYGDVDTGKVRGLF